MHKVHARNPHYGQRGLFLAPLVGGLIGGFIGGAIYHPHSEHILEALEVLWRLPRSLRSISSGLWGISTIPRLSLLLNNRCNYENKKGDGYFHFMESSCHPSYFCVKILN